MESRSAPQPPLSWSKLGQASFWNSKKWLHTNKNHEEAPFQKIAKLQNSRCEISIYSDPNMLTFSLSHIHVYKTSTHKNAISAFAF